MMITSYKWLQSSIRGNDFRDSLGSHSFLRLLLGTMASKGIPLNVIQLNWYLLRSLKGVG